MKHKISGNFRKQFQLFRPYSNAEGLQTRYQPDEGHVFPETTRPRFYYAPQNYLHSKV